MWLTLKIYAGFKTFILCDILKISRIFQFCTCISINLQQIICRINSTSFGMFQGEVHCIYHNSACKTVIMSVEVFVGAKMFPNS